MLIVFVILPEKRSAYAWAEPLFRSFLILLNVSFVKYVSVKSIIVFPTPSQTFSPPDAKLCNIM